MARGATYEVFDNLDLDDPDSVTWQGQDGYVYFLQWSNDLTNWNYVSTIYQGAGSYNWAYPITSDTVICRVLAVYVPSTDPNLDDFDDDGITNLAELSLGLNPLNPDSDGDGFEDGLEQELGTNPLLKDHVIEWTGTNAIVLTPTS